MLNLPAGVTTQEPVTMDEHQPRWSSRLPEDYGEGQRQYDMVSTALRAAEPWVWAASVLAGSLAATWFRFWPGLLLAIPVYLLGIRPLKRAKEAASTEWARERAAWEKQFER